MTPTPTLLGVWADTTTAERRELRRRPVHHLAAGARHTGPIDLTQPELVALMSGVDLDRLSVLPGRPAWWADAACRGRPEVNFFPTLGEPTAPAKAVCAGCPAREACLAFAVEEHIDHGVWGGQSARDRKRDREGDARRRPKAGPVRAGRWRHGPDVERAG